ncbi:F420-dependent oxidoreductase [Mycobacterium sp. GA-1285]|uniref:TIGR03667 family PPOX class F420-dependent oxidoreductase n=1 Tax=Mycobacterium sp. GA-1285 TaxID=1772282 RepID=UPI0007470E5B|nr:TIGR03667 family PPOX class F420-dependent oxidoreductase [Mycobacterium sp. GA-1285]KUI16874.1 F420-dependent oxidoreductase [Mycobacterium sp. GA-1285]
MAVNLTQEVIDRLSADKHGWLTTVAKSGQPVPRLVWFCFDGTDVFVYSEPGAGKVRHIRAHPRVSLNLDSDGNGGGIIVVGGTATVDAENANPLQDERYRAKYVEYAASLGFTDEFLSAYDTRLKISIDKVWTTPTEG